MILFAGLLLLSCTNNNTIIGVYNNTAEVGANHYINFKPNGDFEHVYENGTVKLVNNGHWKYHTQKNKVSLDNWVGFGLFKDERCDKGCYATINVRDDSLILSEDLPERNFKKTE
jgi:hypothetical protein